MALTKWAIFSAESVFADPEHREHLRPKFKKGQRPPQAAYKEFNDQAVYDRPVEPMLNMMRAFLSLGHNVLLIGNHYFPMERWAKLNAPDLPMARIFQFVADSKEVADQAEPFVYRMALPKSKAEYPNVYDAHLFRQLVALKDQGDEVGLAVCKNSNHVSYLRYLFPDAIAVYRPQLHEGGKELREQGKAAAMATTLPPAPLSLKSLDRDVPPTAPRNVRYSVSVGDRLVTVGAYVYTQSPTEFA